MNTLQLKEVIKEDPITRLKFCGVYAENNLPKTLNVYPCGLIANTDPKGKPGKHWVSFYFPSSQEGEFFDSYGHPPNFYSKHFVKFLNRNAQNWIFNHKELQSIWSSVCGQYCIFYVLNRAHGVRMSTIVNVFSSNKERNDHQVHEFVRKLMRQ